MNLKQNLNSGKIQSEIQQLSKVNNHNDSRACLFNLIVYTQDAHRIQYFKEIVKMIMSQFPCRIIFIQGDPSSKENHIHMQIFTGKATQENEFNCDQIFIEAKGEEIKRVYYLLLPLFVPDLPIYLIWGQNPTVEHTILPQLEHFGTRLIFDSEAFEDLQKFSHVMLEKIKENSVQIIDMNWARIGGWREILAQVFDSEERVDQLQNASIIHIFYNDKPRETLPHPETQAIYLQAWLASCLGWKFEQCKKDGKSIVIQYANQKIQHTIYLSPQVNQDLESEEILSLKIEGTKQYNCLLERNSFDQIKVSACNQFQCELPFTLRMPNIRSGRKFMQEVFFQKMSEHYPATLKYIGLVKWS